jgi:hypothetical protein
MAAQLSRPGVEVIQVFRAVSPTVITPTLVPNIVGVGKQIVEVLVSDGAGGNVLNTDANIQLPGQAIAIDASGDPAVYTGLDGLALVFSVNGGINVTVTFSDPTAAGLTPATVVSQVIAAMTAAGVTAGTAEVYGDDGWRLRTVGVGEFQSVVIKSTSAPVVLSAFGFGAGKTYAGLSSYNQYIVDIPQLAFPDPRGNIDELAFLSDTVRVFLATGNGTNLQEARRTAAFLRNGSVDDVARITGSVNITTLTYPGDVTLLTLTVTHNTQTVLYTVGTPVNTAAFIAELDAAFSPIGVSVTLFGINIRFETTTGGVDETLTVGAVGNTLPAVIGVTIPTTAVGVSIVAPDDGNGDAVTSLITLGSLLSPLDFTIPPSQAVLTSSAGTYPLALDVTLVISDGSQPQTIMIPATTSYVAAKAALTALLAPAAGGKLTISGAADVIVFTHSDTGTDSMIEILTGINLADIGLAVGITRGVFSKPLAGDELWIDGLYYADITEVTPGSVVDRVRINRQVTISENVGANWYIIAKNLTSPPAATRPRPELAISLTGSAIVKQEMLRDITGARITAKAPLYLAYEAVRQDVSPLAEQPGLLRFDDTTQLDSALSPISTGNPLALGLFMALINAPGIQVTGIGVDAVTADAPYGTVEAFARSAEFLEAQEVYAIAPLTHDETVHQIFKTHVDVMSAPENKGERIVLINPSIPTTRRDTLVASGTTGDRISTIDFDTKVANISALVLNAGISPIGTITVSKGLFLDITSDANRYSIESITGSIVSVRDTTGDFAPGENDDGFYATDPLPSPLISETFAIKVRGTPLVTVNNTPDNQGTAETIQLLGQAYLDRRVWMVVPDKCAATLEGLEQVIEGFYMCAAIAGMIGQQPPQQSFTNFPMTGFTRVIGSNDRFSQRQINVMAAGGAYVIVQDAQGAPLISQFALTTDLTSIETRTDSITKVVDFTAKFLRRGIKNFIGRFNITQGLLDTLSSVIQGLLGFLIENGVLIGADLNNIIQDEDAPDTVLVEVRLDVPYPCNFIKLTLQI